MLSTKNVLIKTVLMKELPVIIRDDQGYHMLTSFGMNGQC